MPQSFASGVEVRAGGGGAEAQFSALGRWEIRSDQLRRGWRKTLRGWGLEALHARVRRDWVLGCTLSKVLMPGSLDRSGC